MKDRLILVTGAGGGLGNCVVKELVCNGFTNIVAQYRNRMGNVCDHLDNLSGGSEARLFNCELSASDSVERMHSDIKKRFGNVYGVVNLAGSSVNGVTWKMSSTDFSRVLSDNLLSCFNVCHEFVQDMREQEEGRIINATSIIGFTGCAGAAAYCAAKAGVVAFTKSLALEVASKSVTANALGLGYFDSGLIEQLTPEMQADVIKRTPLKRLGSAEDVGGLVKYLLSDEASFVTGQVLHVNGGLYL